MAREGVVPAVFATIHPVRRSPWVSLISSDRGTGDTAPDLEDV